MEVNTLPSFFCALSFPTPKSTSYGCLDLIKYRNPCLGSILLLQRQRLFLHHLIFLRYFLSETVSNERRKGVKMRGNEQMK